MHNIINNLKNNITDLSAFHSRYYLNVDNTNAANYLYNKLISIGYTIEKDSFMFESKPYYNLIAKLNHNSDKTYIVCAHYDSICSENTDNKINLAAPGADDNASGVAIVFELARVLKTRPLNVNIEFIFFNLEEQGAIGSTHLAEIYSRSGKSLEGVINLDTLGTWPGPISEECPLTYVTDENSVDIINKLSKHFAFPFEKCKDLWTDDHGSFWKVGYKAIELTEYGVTEYMHTKHDTAEKLNYDNMNKITQGLIDFFINL